MLFNSYEFVFVFLPATLLLYLAFGRISRGAALAWVILASVLFYAWWRPLNLAIIVPSILVNYGIARLLLPLAGDASRAGARTALLTLGVLFNVAVLGVFKYANFAAGVANDVAGTHFVLEQIVLPLGLSFITFQKIAFLIDVAGGRVKSFTFRDFLLFVMFFPQLIAGPIIHYRETLPQFRANEKMTAEIYATAITLFCFGLFKKVVLADGVAPHVTPIFDMAAAGGRPSFLQAWQAAVGFTAQIYFDFSGYTDMACGAALLFGVRLPMNFDSPLKATSIIDFWLRWHITLTRFLTAYIYNPITLAITRRRAGKKLPLLKGRGSRLSAFAAVLAGPTLLTMLVSGVWHGAGYTFIVWGLIHGGYLVVNHAWRQYVAPPPAKAASAASKLVAAVSGFLATFTAVAAAMVVFRAPDLGSAADILRGMIGLNGLSLPASLASLAPLPGVGVMQLGGGQDVPLREFVFGAAAVGGALLAALVLPNSVEVLQGGKPVLNLPAAPRLAGVAQILVWRPTLPWMLLVAAVGGVAVTLVAGESEFLYWQF